MAAKSFLDKLTEEEKKKLGRNYIKMQVRESVQSNAAERTARNRQKTPAVRDTGGAANMAATAAVNAMNMHKKTTLPGLAKAIDTGAENAIWARGVPGVQQAVVGTLKNLTLPNVDMALSSPLMKNNPMNQQIKNDILAGQKKLDTTIQNIAAEAARRQQYMANKTAGMTGVEEAAFKLSDGVFGMLPAVGVGMLTKNPVAAKTIMSGMAGGASANQALNEGASIEQAVKYGTAEAVKEYGTESLTGGLIGLGGGIINPRRIIGERISNPVARTVAGRMADSAGEGMEEVVSTYLTPYLQRHYYNPDAKNATKEELGESAILGAAVAAIMGIPVDVYNGINSRQMRVTQGISDALSTNEQAHNSSEKTFEQEQSMQERMIENAASRKYTKELDAGIKNLIKQVQDRSGIKVEIMDGLPKASAKGMYQNGVIYLDGNKIDSERTVLKLLTHEVYHGLKNMPEAKDIQDIMLDYYKLNDSSITFDRMLEQKINEYAAHGIELDNEAAYDELGAEFVETVLVDEQVAQRIWNESPSTGQRILGWIRGILQRFTGRKLTEVERQQATLIKKAERNYINAMQKINYRRPEQSENVLYSTENNDDSTQVVKKIEANIQKIYEHGVITKIEGERFSGINDFKEIRDSVTKMFDELGNSVTREGFGEVTLSRKTVKDSISHGTGQLKNVAFEAVPDVIKYGIEVDYQKNWKNRGYDTYIFAGLVMINEKPVHVGVVVRSGGDYNKYYLHEVYIDNDTKKVGASQPGSRNNRLTPGGANLLLTDSISQTNKKNNSDPDIRYSLNDSSRMQEMINEYGSIPPGENPTGNNRDIQIPRQTNDFDRVRQFGRTAMEAEQVDDTTANIIQNELESDLQSGRFVYEPTSNKSALAVANERIRENGWEETGRQLHSAVRSGQRLNSDDIATLERLVQEAQKAGEYGQAVDFISDLAVIGTESGQNIQALKMLKRLTPEGQLMALKKTQLRINNSLIKMKRATVPMISDTTAQEFLQARGNAKRSEIWDREIMRMAQQTEGSWADKINAIRYAAMLSNPKTSLRNIFSNFAMQAAMIPTNIISAALEDAASLTHRQMNPGGITLEQNHSLKNRTGQKTKELRKFAELVWEEDGKAAMRNTGNRYNDVSGQFATNRRIFGHSKVGNVLETLAGNDSKISVGNVLDAEDMMFKHVAFVNALVNYMKANGITTQDAALNVIKPNGASINKGIEYAGLQARKATFTEENKLANALNKLENTNAGTKLAMGAVLPFKRTPMNIVTRGVEYSPVGLIVTGYKLQDAARNQKTMKRYDENKGAYVKEKVSRESKYTVNDVLESLAANITGSGLLAAGIYLAAQGFLIATGNDDDKRKEKYDSQMGSQNFAVVLSDGSTYTIDWLSPSAMSLFTGVEVYNQLFNSKYDETNEAVLAKAISVAGKIADPVFEMSCMQGVASALASYSGDAGDIASTLTANVVTGYAGQFVPAPFGAVARTVDDTVRSSYAPKNSPYTQGGERFVRQQMNKIPGLSFENEASIDVWGNERKREFSGYETKDVIARALNNLMNPGNYSSNKKTVLDRELEKLYKRTGNNGVLPKAVSGTINATQQHPAVYLNAQQYTRYAKTAGRKKYSYVGSFVSSDYYRQLSDDDKVKIISNLYELANYEAKKQALRFEGVNYSSETYEKVLSSGVKPYEYYAVRKLFDNNYDYEEAAVYKKYCDRMDMEYNKFIEVMTATNTVNMVSDRDAKGKEIKGRTRQDKVRAYLQQQINAGNMTREQAEYVLTKWYPSRAKNSQYSWIRQANQK